MKLNIYSIVLFIVYTSNSQATFFLSQLPNTTDTEEYELKIMKHFFNQKKVLVTGGTGFIGSHIIEKLVMYGAQVTVLDNLSTDSCDLATVQDNITFIKGDIINYQTCIDIVKEKEIIFHLAAFVSVPDSIVNPQNCFQTNVIGTFNLLQAAQLNNTKRFIFSSSAAVYGPQKKPCHEEMQCKPQSPYAHSKLIGEHYCRMYANIYKVPSICLRYFNVFGPRQNPHGSYAGVMAKFKENMKQNKPITLFGNGKQTRDFIPVEKVAEANLAVSMAPASAVAGQIFNVATGTSTSLLQLIEQLKKQFPQFTAGITFAPVRSGDIKHSHADISKLKAIQLKTRGDITVLAKYPSPKKPSSQ